MKQLLLTSCLVILCASSVQAEEVQKQATQRENVAKYCWIAMRVGYLGLCAYNLKLIANKKDHSYSKQHRQFNKIFMFATGLVVAKSLYHDLIK